MPGDALSTLTPDDRRVLLLPATRAARQRIASFVPLVLPHLTAVRATAPSYVVAELDALLTAIDRWRADETELLKP